MKNRYDFSKGKRGRIVPPGRDPMSEARVIAIENQVVAFENRLMRIGDKIARLRETRDLLAARVRLLEKRKPSQ